MCCTCEAITSICASRQPEQTTSSLWAMLSLRDCSITSWSFTCKSSTRWWNSSLVSSCLRMSGYSSLKALKLCTNSSTRCCLLSGRCNKSTKRRSMPFKPAAKSASCARCHWNNWLVFIKYSFSKSRHCSNNKLNAESSSFSAMPGSAANANGSKLPTGKSSEMVSPAVSMLSLREGRRLALLLLSFRDGRRLPPSAGSAAEAGCSSEPSSASASSAEPSVASASAAASSAARCSEIS
mmetsp:Transcript_31889/g.91017  ORF Transcript_31889/g.91017 Transcript_31889/m.91017 type:complete len:238 (-) Transcript_31889:557-1270(-)